MLLAYFEEAEQFLRSLINEFNVGKSIFKNKFSIAFQPMELIEGGLSPVEKRAFRDTAEFIGGNKVVIIPHTNQLLDEEIIELFNKP